MEATITYENEKPVKAEGFLKIAAVLKPGYIESLDLSKNKLTYEMLFTLCSHLSEDIQVKQLNIGNNKELEAAAYEKVVEIVQKTKVTSLVLANCGLDKEKLQVLQRSLKRKNIKLEVLALSENKEMKASDFQIIAELLQTERIDGLALSDCDLTSEKVSAFLQYSEGRNFQVPKLEINKNKSMKPEAYSKLAEVIQQMKVEQLWMKDCALDKDKLKAFHDALRGRHVQLSHLYLDENKTMEAEEFEQMVGVCQLANVETLSLANCDLNHKKLSCLNEHLGGKNVKIPRLKLGNNRRMEPEAYKEVAEIITKAKVDHLWLDNCNLNEHKLDELHKSLKGKYVRIHRLNLSSNRYMEAACYCEIVRCVEAAKVDILLLENCDLNERKLDTFQSSLKGRNVELVGLVLDRNKSITPEGFQYIGKTLEVASNIEILNLRDCALTADKLRALNEALAENVKITGLDVSNNQQMGAACYLEVVNFIEKTKVDKLWMNNCDLDERKLSVFQSSLKGKNIKMEFLGLNQNGSIEPAGFMHIAEAFVNADIEGLGLWDCELTSEKLQAFNSPLQGKDVKISKLELGDNKHMELAAYGEVATLIQRAKVDMLWLNRCDLNKEKLSAFQNGLKEGSAEMHQLSLDGNKAIEPDGFCCLADIFSVAQIKVLTLSDCDLTSQFLKIFGERIREMNVKVKLNALLLNRNNAIEPEGFEYIADICWNLGVEELQWHDCALTPAKLSTFSKHIHEKMLKLSVQENKDMLPRAYQELAEVVETAHVDVLWLNNCDLDMVKLQAFQKGLKGRNVKVTQLSITGNKTLDYTAYEQIPRIAEAARIQILLMDDCDIDKEKLSVFAKAFENRNIKMVFLSLDRNKKMDEESFLHIARIVKATDLATLRLSDCDLSPEMLQAFARYLTEQNAQIPELDITNNRKIDSSSKVVEDIKRSAKIRILLKGEKNQKMSQVNRRFGRTEKQDDERIAVHEVYLSRSIQDIRKSDTADSGVASRSSGDLLSERAAEKAEQVETWLGTESHDIFTKVAEIQECCRMPHSTELTAIIKSMKDLGMSASNVLERDQDEASQAFVLKECIIKLWGADLKENDEINMQIFKVIQSALGLRHDKELQTQLVLNCHEEICNMYLVLHKFEEAAEFCDWGIQLMREVQEPSPQTNSCIASLQQHAGFAHASLFNFAAAESYYLKAKAYYSLKPAENGSEEKLVFLSKALESIQTVLRDQPWHDASMEVEKRISEGGSIITLEDCIIDFPMGSLPSDTNVHVSLKESMPDALSGLVPITPVIKLTPCMKLLRAATVKIETWCINENGGEAYLYFKERGNSEWKQIQTLRFEHERLLEFQIKQFCEFCVVTKSAATGNEFAIESCLFHNKMGQLANFVIPNCSTRKRVIRGKMRSRKYEPTCSNDLIIYAKMNDVIAISLSPGENEEEKFTLPERAPTISNDLMRGIGVTDQGFLLPKKCEGRVDLKHTVKLWRGDRLLKDVTHDDRIHVEDPDSGKGTPQNLATVHYMAGHSKADITTTKSNVSVHAGNK